MDYIVDTTGDVNACGSCGYCRDCMTTNKFVEVMCMALHQERINSGFSKTSWPDLNELTRKYYRSALRDALLATFAIV